MSVTRKARDELRLSAIDLSAKLRRPVTLSESVLLLSALAVDATDEQIGTESEYLQRAGLSDE